MAETILSSVVDDQDILSNERVVDMRDTIDLLQTDSTQFSTALMKIASRPANSSKVEWLEDVLYPRKSALAASAASAATGTTGAFTVTTNEGSYFNVGDVCRLATGEALEITATAASAITANRSLGRVASVSAQTGTEIFIIGNAQLQGASAPTPKVTKRVAAYNYTQIFRHSWSFTRTLTQSKLYGGSEPNKERKKKAIEHKRAIEASLFWGARSLDTSGSEPQGFMGGLYEYITTNVQNAGGSLTASTFDGYLMDWLQYGEMDSKVFFASPVIAKAFSGYTRDNWVQAPPSTSIFGVKVDGFISGAYGSNLPIFVKREWGEFARTGTGFGTYGFLVDMDAVTYRPLQPTVLLRSRQAPDADKVLEEYLTETSLEVLSEKKHAVLYGVTG